MARRSATVPWIAAIAAAAITAACSGRTERAILDRFFELSRLRDRTALAPIATVLFEPFEDGIVDEFDVVRVAPEARSGSGQSEVSAKEVTVDADVRGADGKTVRKRLIVTMQRPVSGEITSWKITGVAAFPQSPS